MKYAIAIDIGGTNTRVALVDENYQIESRVQFPTNNQDPEETLGKIAKTILAMDKEIVGVGMSCPGPLDLINNTILVTPNLKGDWQHYPVAKKLEEKINMPVYLNNDANLAALAEAMIGEGKDYNTVQFLTISTGVGAGLVMNKEIHLGAHGFANEVEHCIMIQDGPSHGTIHPGGIEAICSGTAITLRAKAFGLEVAHAGEVNDLALQGNEAALSVMKDAKNYLANFIAFIYAYMDPDIVILGGSVALKIDGFVEEVDALVKEKALPELRDLIRIRKTTLSEDSGLLGAACLAFSKA